MKVLVVDNKAGKQRVPELLGPGWRLLCPGEPLIGVAGITDVLWVVGSGDTLTEERLAKWQEELVTRMVEKRRFIYL